MHVTVYREYCKGILQVTVAQLRQWSGLCYNRRVGGSIPCSRRHKTVTHLAYPPVNQPPARGVKRFVLGNSLPPLSDNRLLVLYIKGPDVALIFADSGAFLIGIDTSKKLLSCHCLVYLWHSWLILDGLNNCHLSTANNYLPSQGKLRHTNHTLTKQ